MSNTATVFMFSGQGSHYHRMGAALYESNAVFRDWMQRLDAVAHTLCGKHVLDAIGSGEKSATFDRTLLTHPAIFMVEYSLAQCLMHAGVRPDVTLGASLGSFVAATIAGCLDVEHALAAVIAQANAFEATCERGGMIAVLAEPSLYDESFLSERSEMAGVNFATHFAVSAAHGELDAIEAALRQRGVAHQRLAVSYAFHSRWIDNARDTFAETMRATPLRAPALPVVCCDRAATLARLPDDFFWNVVRRPIRFRDAIAHREALGAHRYIDVGPSGTLATFVKYALPATSRSTAHAILTPYGRDVKNFDALLAEYRDAGAAALPAS